MKRYLYLFITFFLSFLLNEFHVYASDFSINGEYNYININNQIDVYKNNIYQTTIKNSKFLDANGDYVIYNLDDCIWIYDLESKENKLIISNGYNAMLLENYIIYESDYDDSYICKNLVGSVTYRNCYKLYLYNILDNNKNLLLLSGGDNYLNDIEDNKLIYTSIHTRDEICNSICSFVNIYDLNDKENLMINEYEEILLDMSGNAIIDNNIVYFETVPNIYGCNYTQIFSYNIITSELELITKNETSCFSENSEIIDAKDGYLLFKSKFDNYDNSNEINYIYSYDDELYSKVNEELLYANNILINDYNVWCLDGNVLKGYPIDNTNPLINTLKSYTALLEDKEKLIGLLEYNDNLSSKKNIFVELLDEIDKVGEYFINVRICDKFENCLVQEVLVNVIDVDSTPPKIYCESSITIKNNEILLIEKYGFSIDNVDGKIPISIVGDNVYSKKGVYTLLVESKDSSGNIAYQEIELIVYDNLKATSIYFMIVFISIIFIAIIYILRFKKSR